MLSTPLGPIPFTLEDVSPWCHLDCPDDVWLDSYGEEEIAEGLAGLGLAEFPLVRAEQCTMPEEKQVADVRDWLDRCAVVDKLTVLCGVSPSHGCSLTEGMSSLVVLAQIGWSTYCWRMNTFSRRVCLMAASVSPSTAPGASMLSTPVRPVASAGRPMTAQTTPGCHVSGCLMMPFRLLAGVAT